MKNFVLLYTGGFMPESEVEQAEVMGAWGAWYEGIGAAVVDGGNPFGAAKSVGADGVTDAILATPAVTGYTVISAESLDDALAKVDGHPHIRYGGHVSVYETFQM